MTKIMEEPNQDSWSLRRDLNQGTPEYEAGVLITELRNGCEKLIKLGHNYYPVQHFQWITVNTLYRIG
jgi:hypothetical protein